MIIKSTSLLISFMGVDGSGKTFLSKKIKKLLPQSQYLHLKPYILIKDRRTVIKYPQNQKKSMPLISLLRLLSWLISYKIFFSQNKKKKIYIFDRYAHDILVDPKRYKHNLYKTLTKFILSFFPAPDLWIFLKPTLKTIKSRKVELTDNEMRRQIKEYSIFFKNKNNVLILNTNVQSNILIKKIKKKIDTIIK